MKKLGILVILSALIVAAGCQSDSASDPANAPAAGTSADNTAGAQKGGEAATGPEPTPGPGISGAESRVGSQVGG